MTNHPLLSRLPLAAGPVLLRALRPADLDDFVDYRADPDVARYQDWAPMSPEKAAAFIDEMSAPAVSGQRTQVDLDRAP